jgi:8-oxo-dGTP diphosphatase
MSERALFKVGCEIFVRKGSSILLGKRTQGAGAGAGTWGLPGGHLERGERLVDAACREIKEELGASVKPADLQLVSIVDDPPTPENDNHYIHVTFELRPPTFEPKRMEPDKCGEWRYFELDALPLSNLFAGHKDIIRNYLQHRLYAK